MTSRNNKGPGTGNDNFLAHDFEFLPLPTDFEDPLISDVLQHWKSIREDRPLPSRRSIDPTAIPQCLPHVWLYRYAAEEDDFICRLSGAEVNSAWGFSIMGMRTANLFTPENLTKLKRRWKIVLETPAVMHSKLTTLRETQSFKRAERLTLPLADDDGNPAFIFGVTHYIFDKYYDKEKAVAPPEEQPIFYTLD